MRPSAARTWIRRSTVITTVGALSLGLLPTLTTWATAAAPSPVISYIDAASGGVGTAWLRSAAPDGSSPLALTPANYQTYDYDVSHDGNTLLLSAKTGPAKASNYDRTYALVLVRRAAGVTSSRVLATHWDSEPVLSADGLTAWWMSSGRVWKHTGGVTTAALPATAFAPRKGEATIGFAVSPDGTKGAVLQSSGGGNGRVFAASFATGRAGPFFEVRFGSRPSSTLSANVRDLTWLDDTTLLLTMKESGGVVSRTGILGTGGSPDTSAYAALDGFYDIRPLGPDWWMWKDSGATTSYGTTADLSTAQTLTLTPRSNGPTTFRYLPSTATPPGLTSATNRARTYPFLTLSTKSLLYGKRVAYLAFAFYLTPTPGETLRRDAGQVARGVLQWSLDGTTWRNVTATNWVRPVAWPTKAYRSGNGYSPALTRNTWFRWVYPGDYFTAPSLSRTQAVTVAPIVRASVTARGTYRIVAGRATRAGGTAVLYRKLRGSYTQIATARLTARGLFSFGNRRLPRGTYSVVTLADRHWAAGLVRLIF